jgi:hypothetical protein
MSRLAKATMSGAMALGLVCAPTAAFAAGTTHCDAYSHTCVKGVKHFRHPAPVPQQVNVLPFTGGDIAALSATSLLALGAGTVLVIAGRRRRSGAALA